MSIPIRTFFDHSRHKLHVLNTGLSLDVLAFHGEEQLSQPFHYVVEFTCTEQDLAADQLLNREAQFNLHPVLQKLTFLTRDLKVKPLRTFNGVITGFKRLSGSVDEARYEITLQPRLALLARGQQFRIYQHQSVLEIVEHILRSRHDFRGQDFFFKLMRNYPRHLEAAWRALCGSHVGWDGGIQAGVFTLDAAAGLVKCRLIRAFNREVTGVSTKA